MKYKINYIFITLFLLLQYIAPLNAQITFTTNVICKGTTNGFIDIDFEGGCPPYDVVVKGSNSNQVFNNLNTSELSVDDLAAGKYQVFIKDMNGCSLSGLTNISQTSAEAYFLEVTPSIIDGEAGSITIRVKGEGEAEPFTVTWTNETGGNIEVITVQTLLEEGITSIDDLDAGDYCAEVVNANGCSKKICTSVSSLPNPCTCSNNEMSLALEDMFSTGNGVTIQGTNLLNGNGENGSISIDESLLPCNAPFTFSWYKSIQIGPTTRMWVNIGSNSNFIENLGKGRHLLRIIDACGNQGEMVFYIPFDECVININEQGFPIGIGGATIVESAFCEENSGSISPFIYGYNEPIVYEWSNGAATKNISNLAPDNYCLTITSVDDCVDSACFDISSEAGLVVEASSITRSCFGSIDIDGDGEEDVTVSELGSITVEVTQNGVFPAGDVTIEWEDGPTGETYDGLEAGEYCVTVEIGDGNICSVTECFWVYNTSPIPSPMLTADCQYVYYCGEDPAATFDAPTYYEFNNGDCLADVICRDTGLAFDIEEGEYGEVFEPDRPTDCEGLQVPCSMNDGETYNIDIPNSDGEIRGGFYMINMPGPEDDDNPWGAIDGKCYAVRFCELSNGFELEDPIMEIVWNHPNPILDSYKTQGRDIETGQCYEYYFCDPTKPFVRKRLINDNLCANKLPDLPIEISSISYGNTLVNYLGANSIPHNLYSINQFDPNLNPVWEETLSGAGKIWGMDIGNLYDGSVLSVGHFTEDIQDANDWMYPSTGEEDIFFVKHDVQGNRKWLKTVGGTGTDKCNSIAVDYLERIWLTGSFTDEIDIEHIRLTGTGQETYFAKYNSLGYLLWAKTLEGTGNNTGLAVETDHENNAYLLGSFQDDIQFGGKSSENNDSYSDMFLAKYDEDGNFCMEKTCKKYRYPF